MGDATKTEPGFKAARDTQVARDAEWQAKKADTIRQIKAALIARLGE